MGEMKTQVIQLDANDDFISVRDKMLWTKMSRTLLVFPHRARILARKLDLLRLKRHAIKLGSQLAVVTRSNETRDLCSGLDIPVFRTTSSAQREDWISETVLQSPTSRNRMPDLRKMRETLYHPQSRQQSSFAFRFLFFTLGLLAVAAILMIFLPSASITLIPQTTTQTLTLTVHASQDMSDIGVASTVMAYSLSAVVNGSQTITASGTMIVPDGYSAGIVRFENLTESVVGIPVGTVVSTPGSSLVRFTTMEDSVLPAGVGEWLDVPVQALEAGRESNLLPGTITAIEGELGASVSVTNPQPLTGGTVTNAPIATAEDRLDLQHSLFTSLVEECENDLKELLPRGALYFPDTLDKYTKNETYFPAESQPGETLSLMMELECRGQYASQDDMLALAITALDTNLPEGFVPQGDSPTLENGSITSVDGALAWEMTVERPLRAQMDPAIAALLVIGLGPEAAASQLSKSLSLAAPPVITITPSWWPRLPLIPLRVTFLIPGD